MIRACLVVLLFLLPLCAFAQAGIHRCIGADGNPLFTDQPCAALQATPVNTPPPAPRSPVTQEGPTLPGPAAPTAPAGITCATSVGELRQTLVDAFATRDPNRLAGLMIWNGYGQNAVVADIRSLGTLMQRPLLDVSAASDDDDAPPPTPATSSPDATAATAPPRPASPGTDQLVVHTAASDGTGVPHETRFSVVRRAGCLWLRAGG